MSIGVVAKLPIAEGKESEFESLFKELMAIVAEKEGGNTLYALHRPRDGSSNYMVMEQYNDQASLDEHGKSDEFRAVSARLGEFLAGAPFVEIFDEV